MSLHQLWLALPKQGNSICWCTNQNINFSISPILNSLFYCPSQPPSVPPTFWSPVYSFFFLCFYTSDFVDLVLLLDLPKFSISVDPIKFICCLLSVFLSSLVCLFFENRSHDTSVFTLWSHDLIFSKPFVWSESRLCATLAWIPTEVGPSIF